jgi:signal transduction histidine kinase/ActR/RegA family two-component response regulator
MNADANAAYSERVVVVPPTRRDGEVTLAILGRAGIDCELAPDVGAAATLVMRGIGALILTDVSLVAPEMLHMVQALAAQPAWSNLPVLALCREGSQSPAVTHLLQGMTNVTVLDRPSSARAICSAVRACLRGRRWQYQIRDQIGELQQVENALRRADRRKDEFIATLAHELRNPLAPLRTGLHLMRRLPPGDEKVTRVQAMMERQLTMLVKLIDELLDVSRIATGKIVLQYERLDMRDVLRGAVESCEPLLQAAGHQLALKLPDRPLWIMGDAARLAQAVSNLLNNAAKYTPNGGHIELALAKSRGDVVVSVSDDGLGIPPQLLDRVFDMFAQVNRTLDRSQGGLGIGLSLVRSVVALHGGSVNARSAGPGQGSCFTLRIPAGGRMRPTELAPDAGQPAAVSGPAARRLRVLVVDDNIDAADSLAALVQAIGHEVRVAYGGAAGLKEAADFLPEAIFCDLGMPGVNGLELAGRLRADSRFDGTSLIAVTGWGGDDDKERTRGAGFDEHLTKPAGPDNLGALLARLANQPRAGAEAESST